MELFAGAFLLGRLTRNVSPGQRTLKKWLWTLALFSCFLALARPQYGFRMIDIKRKGIDILFALDSSKSMLTEDIPPNRLERAKLAVMDFVGKLDGDRVGLMPFAGSAYLMTPLTIDYSAFEESLGEVNSAIIPKGGTDLAAAIAEAEAILKSNANHKILILLTDGENLEGDAQAAAARAAGNGMTIFTVGVGTSQGELIPDTTAGRGAFVKDESGKFITSRLDEKGLAAIADVAGGMYAPLGKNGEGLEKIYQQKLSLIPKKELLEKQRKEPLERFSWPLGAAVLLLMLEFILTGRKTEHFLHLSFVKTMRRRIKRGLNGGTAIIFLLALLAQVAPASSSQGEKAFAKGNFLEASQYYNKALRKNPADPRLHYNSGTAAYKNNLYDESIKSFQQALQTNDPGLREKSYYNLGNALFKRGEELTRTDTGQAGQLWQQALDAYDGSIKLNNQSKDAQENRKLVAKKLEELKKQQQQKEDQQTGEQQAQKEQGQPQQQNTAGPENSSQPGEKSSDQAGDDKPQPSEKPMENGQQQEQETKTKGAENKEATQQNPPGQGNDTHAQPGRMTIEEARQLINSLKAEEGRLNFVPGKKDGEEINKTWKDW
jgi:Ca-activated chloride channel family protein